MVMLTVLKTGPDRPVQPSTGHISGPIYSIKPFEHWINHKPPKPMVGDSVETVLNEPVQVAPHFVSMEGSIV